MRILVTGGFGLVGRSVVAELLARGESVRLFDTKTSGPVRRLLAAAGDARDRVRRAIANLRHGGDRPSSLEVIRGDLCNVADVGEAVRDVDAVIHLGALIPPAADRVPRYASYVNEGGTANIVRAIREYAPSARLVFTSSVAIYGDRRQNPLIRTSDPPHPGADDHYAQQKLAAERTVRSSGLSWVIVRLTYIVSPEKLAMDPLMFSMPLDTKLEICTVGDTARALAEAATTPAVDGRTFNIAGGEACRTTFRDYLDEMTSLFGLGRGFLPDDAFSTSSFHCGYMDTVDSESVLRYQRETLADYYAAVGRTVAPQRAMLHLLPFLREPIRRRLLRQSPCLQPSFRLRGTGVLKRVFAQVRRRRAHP